MHHYKQPLHGYTGLLPDFVVYSGGVYKPAAAGFLEDANDGNHNYNSCRTPWRITTNYLISDDNRALAQLTQLNSWIKTKENSTPGSIKDGFKLNGTTFGSYNSGAFYAPFGVSAMISSSNQSWLNSLWSHTAGSAAEDYYEDGIKMFSMILMSGNWWTY